MYRWRYNWSNQISCILWWSRAFSQARPRTSSKSYGTFVVQWNISSKTADSWYSRLIIQTGMECPAFPSVAPAHKTATLTSVPAHLSSLRPHLRCWHPSAPPHRRLRCSLCHSRIRVLWLDAWRLTISAQVFRITVPESECSQLKDWSLREAPEVTQEVHLRFEGLDRNFLN